VAKLETRRNALLIIFLHRCVADLSSLPSQRSMPERTCAPPRLRSSEPSLAVILGRSATSRSGQSSPTKCSDVRLYDLPPSLESPGSVSIAHRARPGGLAGMRPESYDARSVDSGNLDRRSPSAVPDSDHPLRRGSALGANDSDRRSIPEQGSPSKEQEEPSEEVCHHAHRLVGPS